MNVTLVVCALAMGGWIAPESADTTPPLVEDMSKPPRYTPVYTVAIEWPNDPPWIPPEVPPVVPPPPRRIIDNWDPPRKRQEPVIPLAPTDKAAATSDLLPTTPTSARGPDGLRPGANPGARPGPPAATTNPSRNGKAFSDVKPPPATSPWQGLYRPTGGLNLSNYYNNVLPSANPPGPAPAPPAGP